MNVIELVREYFPLLSEDHCGRILWTCTSYPLVKTNDPEKELRAQLDDISRRSHATFHIAMELANQDLDKAMSKRTMYDEDIHTHEIRELRKELSVNDEARYRINKELKKAEADLILRTDWYEACDAEFNFDGLTFKLWPKQLKTNHNGYLEIGNGICFHGGHFESDTFEAMKAFIERAKFRSVTVAPIHKEVLGYAKQLGLE